MERICECLDFYGLKDVLDLYFIYSAGIQINWQTVMEKVYYPPFSRKA